MQSKSGSRTGRKRSGRKSLDGLPTMDNLLSVSRRCFVCLLLFHASLLAADPKPPSFRLLPAWKLYGREWRVIVVPPNPTVEQVVKTARFIHKQYPKLAFYVVDTDQALAPFSAWTKNDNRPFPTRWAMKHYFGIVNEFIQIGGRVQWKISPAGASSFKSTPLE